MWILFQGVLGWVFRAVVVKFIVFAALYAVLQWAMPHLLGAVSGYFDGSVLNSLVTGMTSGMWYFWDLFGLNAGLPMVIGALCARFFIRRLPVVG